MKWLRNFHFLNFIKTIGKKFLKILYPTVEFKQSLFQNSTLSMFVISVMIKARFFSQFDINFDLDFRVPTKSLISHFIPDLNNFKLKYEFFKIEARTIRYNFDSNQMPEFNSAWDRCATCLA